MEFAEDKIRLFLCAHGMILVVQNHVKPEPKQQYDDLESMPKPLFNYYIKHSTSFIHSPTSLFLKQLFVTLLFCLVIGHRQLGKTLYQVVEKHASPSSSTFSSSSSSSFPPSISYKPLSIYATKPRTLVVVDNLLAAFHELKESFVLQ